MSRILVYCPVHSETHSHQKEEKALQGRMLYYIFTIHCAHIFPLRYIPWMESSGELADETAFLTEHL